MDGWVDRKEGISQNIMAGFSFILFSVYCYNNQGKEREKEEQHFTPLCQLKFIWS
jgi:hypothetical protein